MGNLPGLAQGHTSIVMPSVHSSLVYIVMTEYILIDS